MKAIRRTIIYGTVAVLVSPAAAQDIRVCSADEVATVTIGFSGLECSACTFYDSEDGSMRSWRFTGEPRVLTVDPNGPSQGVVSDGDVLTSIDGMLITTIAAG